MEFTENVLYLGHHFLTHVFLLPEKGDPEKK